MNLLKNILTLMFVFGLSSAWAETVLVTSRGIGSDFTNTVTGDHYLDNTTTTLESQIVAGKAMLNSTVPGKDIFLVGQSMGGVRALGLANIAPNVKAIVTIGSPIKGLSPLWRASGADTTKGVLNNFANVIRVLAKGMYHVNVWKKFDGLVGWLPSGLINYYLTVNNDPDFKKLQGVLQSDTDATAAGVEMLGGPKTSIFKVLASGTAPLAIQDLAPRSTFLQTHVAEETDTPRNVTVPNGTHGEWRWHSAGWWGWPEYVTVQDYRTYTVYDTTVKSKIPPSTYVWNVVGTQTNPFYNIPNPTDRAAAIQTIIAMDNNFYDASTYYNSCAGWYNAAGLYMFVQTAGIGYWAYGPLFATANDMARSRNECDAAQSYTLYPERIVSDTVGSAANDGFIPVSDQSRLDMGGTPLNVKGSNRGPQVHEVLLSHTEETYDPSLWGPGGGLDQGQGLVDNSDPNVDNKPWLVKALYTYMKTPANVLLMKPANSDRIPNAIAF